MTNYLIPQGLWLIKKKPSVMSANEWARRVVSEQERLHAKFTANQRAAIGKRLA